MKIHNFRLKKKKNCYRNSLIPNSFKKCYYLYQLSLLIIWMQANLLKRNHSQISQILRLVPIIISESSSMDMIHNYFAVCVELRWHRAPRPKRLIHRARRYSAAGKMADNLNPICNTCHRLIPFLLSGTVK